MSEQTILWGVFGVLMVVMLAIDLGMNRPAGPLIIYCRITAGRFFAADTF